MVKTNAHIEFVEARARSFSNIWRVADDYRVESGAVIPLMAGKPVYYPAVVGEKADDYMPGSRPEIAAEFAKVADGSEEELLKFVRRYGLLGYHEEWSFQELAGAVGYNPKAKGDPVQWILAHAANIKMIGELADALDQPGQIEALVQQLIPQDRSGTKFLFFKLAGRHGAYPSDYQMRPLKEPRESALQIISTMLNANLGGTARELIVEYHRETRRRQLTQIFNPRNLLDYIYWHLTDAVLGQTIRTCANPKCTRFFIVTHRRMKYCPPPMGQMGVSRCMDSAKHQRKPKKLKRYLSKMKGRKRPNARN